MKHLSLNASLALLVACMALSARATSQIVQTLTYSYSNMHFATISENGTTWLDVSYNGFEASSESGAPKLPCQYLTISVPYNAVNIQVEAESNDNTGAVINKKVLPVQPDVEICDTTNHPFVMDSTIYMTNAYYPSQLARIVSEGYYMGENHLVTVAVFPVEYNPVNNHLRVNLEIELTVSYDLSNDITASNLLVRKNQSLRQQGWDEVKQRVLNPSQVESFAPPTNNAEPNMLRFHDPENQVDSAWIYGGELYATDRSCEYLIVTTRELASSLRRLAALKRQKGYTVGIRCIEDILSSSITQDGDKCAKRDSTFTYINDDAGKLREYLKYYHVWHGTRYVLLAGTNIPIRYGYGTASQNLNYHVPTDWYYCDLTTNWNTNGNTYYGEYSEYGINKETFDLHAELFVGRLMVENEEEVRNYTDKIFKYELNPGNGNVDYLDQALLVTGSQDPGFVTPCSRIRDLLSYIYANVNSINNINSSIPTGSDIVRDINQTKYGFISIIGHGSPHNICVNQVYNSNNGKYEQKHYIYTKYIDRGDNLEDCNGLDHLTNSNYPGVFYTYACDNIPFDIFTEPSNNHTYNGYNMGQEYTMGLNRGGVAYLGNTRSGYMKSSATLMEKFLYELARGIKHVGMTEAYSKYSFKDKYVLMSHNLLGEPEFSIWTTAPSTIQNVCVNKTNSIVTISGLPVGDKCFVSICSNSGYAVTDTTTTGTLTFYAVPSNTTLMVTSNNHQTFIAPLFLQNTAINHSQYVIASDFTAGDHVDGNRTTGEVTIESGVDYEVEHSGKVVLAPGFRIKKGARFSTIKSNY